MKIPHFSFISPDISYSVSSFLFSSPNVLLIARCIVTGVWVFPLCLYLNFFLSFRLAQCELDGNHSCIPRMYLLELLYRSSPVRLYGVAHSIVAEDALRNSVRMSSLFS